MLSEAIRLDPEYADAWKHRGDVWFLDGRREYDKAIADYDQAIKLNPNNSDFYLIRGACWNTRAHESFVAGDPANPVFLEHALDDISQAHRLGIRDERESGLPSGMHVFHEKLAHIYLWSPDPSFRDAKRAVQHARRNCELRNWPDDALELLAFAYADVGQFDDAIEQLERAIAFDRNRNLEKRQRMLESYHAGQKYEPRPEELPDVVTNRLEQKPTR